MHLTSVLLSDSEGVSRSGRPRRSRRIPTMRAAPCRIREFSRELIFLPLQQRDAADLANQFLTEFFQQDSNVQPACILAEKYPHTRQVSGHDFSRAVNDAPNLCPPE